MSYAGFDLLVALDCGCTFPVRNIGVTTPEEDDYIACSLHSAVVGYDPTTGEARRDRDRKVVTVRPLTESEREPKGVSPIAFEAKEGLIERMLAAHNSGALHMCLYCGCGVDEAGFGDHDFEFNEHPYREEGWTRRTGERLSEAARRFAEAIESGVPEAVDAGRWGNMLLEAYTAETGPTMIFGRMYQAVPAATRALWEISEFLTTPRDSRECRNLRARIRRALDGGSWRGALSDDDIERYADD